MKRLLLSVLMVSISLLLDCTWSTAGGTTDTGNARMAAIIYTTTGTRAAGAVVTACPAGYFTPLSAGDSAEAAGKKLRTVTDDTGYFSFSDINDGVWYVEVNDLMSSAVRVRVAIDSGSGNMKIDTSLAPYAMLAGTVDSIDDSHIERYCVFDGLDRRVVVASNGTFKADNLPAGTYHCRIVSQSDAWTPQDFDSVTVFSDSLIYISDSTSDSLPENNFDTTVIVLNTSVSGAEVAGSVTNFPVLVRLDSMSLDFKKAGSGGKYIRFFRGRDETLPFSCEQWDEGRQQAVVWVLVDTIYGNDSIQALRLVCGDTTHATADGVEHSLFDTASGNLACFHFAGSLENASGNVGSCVDSGSTDTASGIIGHARAFNGKNEFFTVGKLPARPAGTISFWFRPDVTVNGATGTTQGIWGKKVIDSINYTISLQGGDYWAGTGSAGALISKLEASDTGYYLSSKRKTFEKGVWYHAVWCWNGDGDSLYVNGTLEASVPGSVPIRKDGVEEIGRSLYDGSNISGGGPLYFHGSLDEFRIERTCRSPSWVKLSYMNQRSDDRLVIILKEGKKIYPLRKSIKK